MSQSSLPKSPRFSQLTPQQVLTALRQPSAIAVLASIAVHGLLAVVLPWLPTKSEEPSKPRLVKVLALTPAEQGRLGVGRGNGFGNGNGLRSSNPLPDLSSLPYSFPIDPPPSPTPSYSPAPLVDPLETYPIDSTRSNSTTDPAPKPSSSTKPSPAPSNNTSGNNTSGNNTSGNNTSGNNTLCPTPPDYALPACKQQLEALNRQAWAFNPANTNTQLAESSDKLSEFGTKLKTISNGKMEINYGGKEVTLPYSDQACRYIPKAKQEVRRLAITAIFAPDKTIFQKPEISTSSGYAPMDAEAIAYVIEQINKGSDAEFKPSKNGNYKGIYVTFTFDPERDPKPGCVVTP